MDRVIVHPDGSKSQSYVSKNTIFQLLVPTFVPNSPTPDVYVKEYVSPADPSINYNPALATYSFRCSYAANMMGFDSIINFPFTIADGTSTTLNFAERYFYSSHPEKGDCYSGWNIIGGQMSQGSYISRRATFADKGWRDHMPIPDGSGMSKASEAVRPFEVQPPVNNSFCRTLQTPHAAGLPVGMFDGSVRVLSPRIDDKIFWSLVTPAGGEAIGDF